MDRMRIWAVMEKQGKDLPKNKAVLIQFIIFPLVAAVLVSSVKAPGLSETFFVLMFSSMFVGMAPLTAMSAIISEEKETRALRMLFVSNVKPTEFLIGSGGFLFLISLLGGFFFAWLGKYQGREFAAFVFTMAIGVIISLMIGAAIGAGSRSQMAATSVTVPVMMVAAFLPMLATFNEKFASVSQYLYTGQLHILLENPGGGTGWENWVILAANMAAAFLLFVIVYRRHGLEG